MPQDTPAGWTEANNALSRTFTRAGFVDALAFVLEVGKLAEAANHHPDIDIRYKTVLLTLQSHDAGHVVTKRDFDLAQKINNLSEPAIHATRDEIARRFAA
jgi:4a-hydroxytetrahydrobiopterin dehydratase